MTIALGHKGVALLCHSDVKYSIFVDGVCIKQTGLAAHAHKFAKFHADHQNTQLIVVRAKSKARRHRSAH